MSWKKFGGIKQFDSFTNLNVNSITTDDFIMREAYKGTFTVSGELFVLSDCSLNSNVGVGKNVLISQSCYVEDTIYIGNKTAKTQNTIKTSGKGLGINVLNPVAILDISGSSSKIMNACSSETDISSTLLKNGKGNSVDFLLDNSEAALLFSFVGNSRQASIAYNVSKELMSINTDISFAGNNFIGKHAIIIGDILVNKNAALLGNVRIGGNLTVSGDTVLSGDLNLKGNASMEYVIVRKETTHFGNIKINGNSGVWFTSMNNTSAVIRPFTSSDTMSTGITIPSGGSQLFLNCDVIIGGNVYIDGSTNLIGNISQLSGISTGGTNIDVSGTLADLSGTDQTRFYVNFNANNTSLAGAGFYIYNWPPNPTTGASFDPTYDATGFIKISDESNNKFSLRTTGERNIVALDLGKLKNKNKSGLLVLKYATDDDTDERKDNYNIISSHYDLSSIDVSNSLTGVVDIHVGNLVFCEKNMYVGKELTVIGNVYLGDNSNLSGNSFEMISGNVKTDLTVNAIMVNMGAADADDEALYKNYQSVAALLFDLRSRITNGGVNTGNNNTFTNTNSFADKTVFKGDVSMSSNLDAFDISCNSVFIKRDTTVYQNAYIFGTTFLKDTSMNGSIDISGNLSVSGASCIFKNSVFKFSLL